MLTPLQLPKSGVVFTPAEHPDWRKWRGEAVRLRFRSRHEQHHHGADVHQGHAALHGAGACAGAALQPHGKESIRTQRPLVISACLLTSIKRMPL